ncbi:MAG: AsmA-like C-terminal region-containing protein, partial [Devosia sp.]
APTARHLNLTAQFAALTPEQSIAISALVPEIGANGSFAATFPKGQVELSAVSATLFGLAGQSLNLSANWDGGVLDVTKLSAANIGGAVIDGSFTAFGTLLKPELSGTGTLKVPADAPVVASLFNALGVAPVLQDTLRRQLPADLTVRLDPPTGEGGQGVSLKGAIATSMMSLDAKLSGGIVGLLDNPLTVSLELDSSAPSQMTAQLGLGSGEIFPQSRPLRLIATLDGAPRETLDTRFTLEGGEDIVSFAGSLVAAKPERVTGNGVVQATLGDPAALLEAFGAGGLAVPQLSGTATLDFAGTDEWRLGQIEARADDVAFTGLLSLKRGVDAAAMVDGSLDFATFDAAALVPLLTGRSGAATLGTGVWPDSQLDIGATQRSVAGRVAVKAAAVTAGGTPFLTDAGFTFDWDKQSVRIRDFEGKAGEGTFSLDAQVCCSGPLPDKRLTGRIALAGADLDFLAPAPIRPVLGGNVDASAQFDGTGSSLAALIATLSGSGSYTIRNFTAQQLDPDAFAAAGQVDGVIDMDEEVLASQLRDKVKAGAFTAPETTGTFTVAGGVLRSPNLGIDGPAARIFGGLSLKLSDLMLDGRYAMTPVAIVEAATGIDPSAEIAVEIGGPLWAPVATVDVSGLVSGMKLKASEDELARLEQLKAEDDARQAAAAAEEAARVAAQQAAAEEAARVAAEAEAARQAAEAAAAAATLSSSEPPPQDIGL